MNSFFIVTNNQKDKNLQLTKQVQGYLLARGASCTVQDENQLQAKRTDIAKIPPDVQCVIVLGGDGTLIQAARDVVKRGLPLIGVNLGTLGYLAEVEEQNVYAALDALLADQCEVEERMMLVGTVVTESGEFLIPHSDAYLARKESAQEAQTPALNDIVIGRRGTLRIMQYRITVNGEPLYTYDADGIVISTPTGSTGYSLSAGGPIISPKASMILLTPICPHSLNTRSIVVSAEDEVMVEIGPGRKLESEYAEVSFDGAVGVLVSSGDRIIVRCAEQKTKIVKIHKESFLETLRKKMDEGSRFHTGRKG